MDKWELGNEFAWVQLEIDNNGLSPRLKIRSLRSGVVGYLDPLELEILASLRHEDLKPLMDPGFDGWESQPVPHVGRQERSVAGLQPERLYPAYNGTGDRG